MNCSISMTKFWVITCGKWTLCLKPSCINKQLDLILKVYSVFYLSYGLFYILLPRKKRRNKRDFFAIQIFLENKSFRLERFILLVFSHRRTNNATFRFQFVFYVRGLHLQFNCSRKIDWREWKILIEHFSNHNCVGCFVVLLLLGWCRFEKEIHKCHLRARTMDRLLATLQKILGYILRKFLSISSFFYSFRTFLWSFFSEDSNKHEVLKNCFFFVFYFMFRLNFSQFMWCYLNKNYY